MLESVVQRILVYTIIVSVLSSLVNQPRYEQYFRFFSGAIMLLLFLTPLLSMVEGDVKWFQILEKQMLAIDVEDIRSELRHADKDFKEMVKKEYQTTIEEQVRVMATEQGVVLQAVEVTLGEQDGEVMIAEISGIVEEASEKIELGDAGEQEIQNISDRTAVETIQLGDGKVEKEDNSKNGKRAKNEICRYYALGKEQVHLWR